MFANDAKPHLRCRLPRFRQPQPIVPLHAGFCIVNGRNLIDKSQVRMYIKGHKPNLRLRQSISLLAMEENASHLVV